MGAPEKVNPYASCTHVIHTWKISIDQLEDWRQLLATLQKVSAAKLRPLLDLEQLTSGATPVQAPHTFYIRSLTFETQELEDVLHCLLLDGYDINDKIFTWIEELGSGDQTNNYDSWTVRYSG